MSGYRYQPHEVKAFEAAHSARLQPRPAPAPRIEAPSLVMVRQGRRIDRPADTGKKMRANPKMHEALSGKQIRESELLSYMQDEKIKLRKTCKAEERRSVAAVQHGKAKAEKKRVSTVMIEDGKERRVVKKIATTCDKMLENGTLPKNLKQALDMFAMLLGDGLGASTDGMQDSSNRLTCGYEPMSTGGGFGSKTPSDRQLEGLKAEKLMLVRVPAELMQTYLQIIGEEIGNMKVPRRTLAQIGEDNGFRYKQASSAGAMEVRAVCSLIAHFIRDQSVTF
jgi:hypothetical protein